MWPARSSVAILGGPPPSPLDMPEWSFDPAYPSAPAGQEDHRTAVFQLPSVRTPGRARSLGRLGDRGAYGPNHSSSRIRIHRGFSASRKRARGRSSQPMTRGGAIQSIRIFPRGQLYPDELETMDIPQYKSPGGANKPYGSWTKTFFVRQRFLTVISTVASSSEARLNSVTSHPSL